MDQLWERMKQVFGLVAGLPEAERAAALERECGGDEELLREVEELLKAQGQARLATGAGGKAAATVADRLREGPGTKIGPYKLLQQVGEGGFGVVFMAEQEHPVRRRVALKIIKLGMDTRAVIARFEAERQALAMMDHPNIARVFDAGSTETGRPYFVMELVKGVPITEYADTNNLSTKERLELFVPVCRAVQHAHQKGIIHRDIKPGNVLVTLHDGEPVPKVIDFGIAKATDHRLTEKTVFTEFRQLIGTPEYMSPEQAEMSGLDVDTRSDVYSLGVLLYELLTGTTPFDGSVMRSKAYDQIQKMIREVDPPRPSVRISTLGETLTAVASHRKVEAGKLSRLVKGDLDWIVMRCLEKDRTRRYDTASDLAADVGRHLGGEAVEAAPPGVGYRVRKFVRRNKAAVLVGGVTTAILLLGIAGTTWGWNQARDANRASNGLLSVAKNALIDVIATGVELDQAERHSLMQNEGLSEEQARRVQASAYAEGYRSVMGETARMPGRTNQSESRTDVGLLASVSSTIARDLKEARRTLSKQVDSAEWAAYTANLATTLLAIDSRDWPEARTRLDTCPEKLRNWIWGYLNTTLNDAAVILHGHKSKVDMAVFSSDGTRVLSIGSSLEDDGTARVWDAESGREVCAVRSTRDHFSSGCFALDGKSFYTFTQPRDWIGDESFTPMLQTWDAATGKQLSQLALSAVIADSKRTSGRASLSPDGTRLLWSRTGDGRSAIIDLRASGTVMWLPLPGWFHSNAPFSPDGSLVCSVSGDWTVGESVKVWDLNTGEVRFETPVSPPNNQGRQVLFTVFSPDSNSLLTNHWSGCTSVWDLRSNQRRLSLFIPEDDGEVRGASTWSNDAYKFPATISPDGSAVASLLEDEQGVRIWEWATGRELLQKRLNQQVKHVQFSPDGHTLAIADTEDGVWLLDANTGTVKATLSGQSFGGRGLNGTSSPFNSSGNRLLTKASNGDVCIWSLPLTPGRTEFASHGETIYRSMFIPSKSLVVAAFTNDTLSVFDARTGRRTRTLPMIDEADKEVYTATAARDGSYLATSSRRAVLRVWNVNDGTPIATRDFARDARADEGRVEVDRMRFLGNRLLVFKSFYPKQGDSDEAVPTRRELVDWDPVSGNTMPEFSQYADCARGVAISPSEDRIVFGAPSGARSLVDARLGETIARLDDWAASGWAPPGAFSPDSALLAGILRTSDGHESLRVWHAKDGSTGPTVPLDQSIGSVQAIRFSPDGRCIALATWRGDGTDGGRVVLIDAEKGSISWSATNVGRNMDNVDFSPDGVLLITSRRMDQASSDVWSSTNGAKVLTLPYGLGLHWSRMEDKDLRCFGDDGVCLFVRNSQGQPVILRSRSHLSP